MPLILGVSVTLNDGSMSAVRCVPRKPPYSPQAEVCDHMHAGLVLFMRFASRNGETDPSCWRESVGRD